MIVDSNELVQPQILNNTAISPELNPNQQNVDKAPNLNSSKDLAR